MPVMHVRSNMISLVQYICNTTWTWASPVQNTEKKEGDCSPPFAAMVARGNGIDQQKVPVRRTYKRTKTKKHRFKTKNLDSTLET